MASACGGSPARDGCTSPPTSDLAGSEAATTVAKAVRSLVNDELDLFVARLESIVSIDSGPDSADGREGVVAALAGWAQETGLATSLYPTCAGSHLVVRLPGWGCRSVVLLGHHDTVFARGTAASRPLHRRGDRLYGPGVADMKGGLLCGLLAMHSLAAVCDGYPTVELHSLPDEETRSWPPERMDLLCHANAAMVLECGRANGDVVVARKAAAWLRVEARGRSAHAGAEPWQGRSALLTLARQILQANDLNLARPGLTVVTGTMRAGSQTNVVPDHAVASLDIRATSECDLDWALEEIAALEVNEGVKVSLQLEGRTPAIETHDVNQALFAEAQRLAAVLGDPVGGQISGGSSDGCWTADARVPTLDGLGPIGGSDHSPGEYIELSSVPVRCGILAGLCVAVEDGLLDGLGGPQ